MRGASAVRVYVARGAKPRMRVSAVRFDGTNTRLVERCIGGRCFDEKLDPRDVRRSTAIRLNCKSSIFWLRAGDWVAVRRGTVMIRNDGEFRAQFTVREE